VTSAAALPAPSGAPARRGHAVRSASDVVAVRIRAGRLAASLGCGRRRATEIAIVVSELASNIVKYGVRGEIAFAIEEGTLVVTASDEGPPIRDLALALTDGCDDCGPLDPAQLAGRGGLGNGLGAVVRLSDRFECRQHAAGKVITVGFRTPAP
jgi:anti-sigma regulatory factor (Ser/Thr protein kinase)